jgi:hypothetical protein
VLVYQHGSYRQGFLFRARDGRGRTLTASRGSRNPAAKAVGV